MPLFFTSRFYRCKTLKCVSYHHMTIVWTSKFYTRSFIERFSKNFSSYFFFLSRSNVIAHSITIFSNSNYLFRYDNIKRIVFFFTRFIRQFIVPWNFYAKWNSLRMITYTSGHKIHYIMLLHGENKLLKWTTENEMAINGQ